jgi:alkylation response protein AidB-like acyl-CoA dehydrogenase
MDFDFTDEQQMLRESIARFAAQSFDFDKRRALIASAEGTDTIWNALAEMGLMAAPLPEAHGGFGGGPVDVLVVMEEMGKALMVEPYVPTVVLGAGALIHAGTPEQQAEHLPLVAAGERRLAFAWAEPKSRFNPHAVATKAPKIGEGYALTGVKSVVHGAGSAAHILVSARTGGGERDAQGLTLFIVPRDASGVSLREYRTIDGRRAADVAFENVKLGAEHVIGTPDQAGPLIERLLDGATVASCGEAVGVLRMLHALTVEYARTRKQFGRAIGEFQVLQHRMVDMFMALEQAVSMTYMATLLLDAPNIERKRAVSAAKANIAQACRFVGQNAIQIHGGMGVSDEMRVGHYFKRATIIEGEFGDADHHLRRFAALGR